jgi:hypothetical protein
MQFNYDHNEAVAASRSLRDVNSTFPPPAFGTGARRFTPDTTSVPGVGEYDAVIDPLIKNSPSFSKKGYSNSFISKAPKILPYPDNQVPGPASYNTDLLTISEISKLGKSTMVRSGKGRVPFDPPQPYPGPLYYKINFDFADPPLLTQKKSATFCSTTGRDSFFDKLP